MSGEIAIRNPSKLSLTKIYDECAYCFMSTETLDCMYVCLGCGLTLCHDKENEHVNLHLSRRPSHRAYALVKKVDIEIDSKRLKMKCEDSVEEINNSEDIECDVELKSEESGFNKRMMIEAVLVCENGDIKLWNGDGAEVSVDGCIDSVREAFQKPSRLSKIELPKICEHVDLIESENLEKNTLLVCKACEIGTNLWICLTCGVVGCGRKQLDGSGGNGHALDHYKETGHSVTVHVTREREIFCYKCDDSCCDSKIEERLEKLGYFDLEFEEESLSVVENRNTEDASKISKDTVVQMGSMVSPGPFRMGIKNFGNDCYMSVIVHVMARMGYEFSLKHFSECNEMPWDCLLCQMTKIVEGIRNGCLVNVVGLGRIVGEKYPDFASGQQQDAFEFLNVIEGLLERQGLGLGLMFGFCVGEERESGFLKVPGTLSLTIGVHENIKTSIDLWSQECSRKFLSTPEILVLHVNR